MKDIMSDPNQIPVPENPYQSFGSPAQLAAHLTDAENINWGAVAERAANMDAEKQEGAGSLAVLALQQSLAQKNQAETARTSSVPEHSAAAEMLIRASRQVDETSERSSMTMSDVTGRVEQATENLLAAGSRAASRIEDGTDSLRPMIGHLEDALDPNKIRQLSEISGIFEQVLSRYNMSQLHDVAGQLARAAAQIQDSQHGGYGGRY